MKFATKPCSGCGRAIIWAQNPDTGKKVPLDATAIVYDVTHHEGAGEVVVARTHTSFVSHFNTCTKANSFSGGKKQ